MRGVYEGTASGVLGIENKISALEKIVVAPLFAVCCMWVTFIHTAGRCDDARVGLKSNIKKTRKRLHHLLEGFNYLAILFI